MNEMLAKDSTSRIGLLKIFLGAWLILSPFVLGFARTPAGILNNILVGAAVILLTLAGRRNGLLRSLVVIMGAWLFASAFILGVSPKAYLWNNLILAVVIVITAVAGESPYPPQYQYVSRPQA